MEVTSTDVKRLTIENQRLARELEQVRAQVQNVPATPEEEEEVSQVKMNALLEVKAMKEAEARRFETWKRESVEEVEKIIVRAIEKKPKSRMTKSEVCRARFHQHSAPGPFSTEKEFHQSGDSVTWTIRFRNSWCRWCSRRRFAAGYASPTITGSRKTVIRLRPVLIYVPPPAKPDPLSSGSQQRDRAGQPARIR